MGATETIASNVFMLVKSKRNFHRANPAIFIVLVNRALVTKLSHVQTDIDTDYLTQIIHQFLLNKF